MSTAPQDLLAAAELIGELPSFAALPRFARTLVAERLEQESYSFGSAIVREGDEADAFYVIVSGSARVIKRGAHGEEIALNVLHRGDSFGESGLLEGASRLATVRASGPVTVLRLRRTVFAGLARAHPEVADALKAVARERSLSNLLRIHSSFASLPSAALGELLTGLEGVDVAAGEIVVFEGEPPGPMYIVDEGRLRAYRSEQGRQHDLQFFRKGDFFGERSLFLGEPRATTVAAVDNCSLLRLPVSLFQKLLDEHPEFRERLAERVRQYDYRRLARVPLDFADEILPAEASFSAGHAPDESSPVGAEAAVDLDDSRTPASPRPRRRFPHIFQLDEADCGAACTAMMCRAFGPAGLAQPHPPRGSARATRARRSLGLKRGGEEIGLPSVQAIKSSASRVETLQLPAIIHWNANHWVVLYAVEADHVRISADRAGGLRRVPRSELAEKWSGYAAVTATADAGARFPPDVLRERLDLSWLYPLVRPHRRRIGFAYRARAAGDRRRDGAADPQPGRHRRPVLGDRGSGSREPCSSRSWSPS